jgi:hypothetical protein
LLAERGGVNGLPVDWHGEDALAFSVTFFDCREQLSTGYTLDGIAVKTSAFTLEAPPGASGVVAEDGGLSGAPANTTDSLSLPRWKTHC